MVTLAGQRAQFTRALNQYNRYDDPDARRRFVRAMAKYTAAAPNREEIKAIHQFISQS
jgi:hypothetical protein